VPAALAASGVNPISVSDGRFPRDGVIVIFGSWQTPPAWLARAQPSRLLVVHNVDNARDLLDLVTGLLAHSSLPVELLMPSEMFRRRTGLPGVAYASPIDLARFGPAQEREGGAGFVVGRVSRNHSLKFHPDDPDLARRMIGAGMRVRIMGGTVLQRYFPPSSPPPGLELLPAGSEDAAAFLRTLDAFFYRASPQWPETAGRVVAEAMATGLPCVCANDVGFAELITHGVNGFVFHPDDDDAALAHAPVRLARRSRAAQRGRTRRSRARRAGLRAGLCGAHQGGTAYLGHRSDVSFPPQ
jgi:glycosyltransferase involved in cell wall biosynthesis